MLGTSSNSSIGGYLLTTLKLFLNLESIMLIFPKGRGRPGELLSMGSLEVD